MLVNNLNFLQSFNRMLKHQKITGKALSETSGISTPHISEIRNGKTNPSLEVFERLIDAAEKLKPGSRRMFASLMAGEEGLSIEELAEQLSKKELGQLLIAIAPRISDSTEETEERAIA